jgi:uncharacterized protein YjbI with pentapeptide repeats
MGVVDSSRDAAIERRLQTINSAYQAYLSSGGTTLPSYYFGSSNIPASAIFAQVAGISQTENGPIGPFLTDWPEASWAGTIPVNMTGGEVKYMQPVFNFTSSTGEVMFYLFPDNSIDIVPSGGGWGSFGSNSWGSGYGSGWGSITSDYQYDWGSGYGSGWGSFGSSYGSGWGSGWGSGYGSDWGSSYGSGWGSGWGSMPWYSSFEGVAETLERLLTTQIAGLPVEESERLAELMMYMSPEVTDLIAQTMSDLGWTFDPNTTSWVQTLPEFDYSLLPDPAPLVAGYTAAADKTAYFSSLVPEQQASLFGQMSASDQAAAVNSFSNIPFTGDWGMFYQNLAEAQGGLKNFLESLPEGYAGLALNSYQANNIIADPNTGVTYQAPSLLNGISFAGMNLWGFDTRGKSFSPANFVGSTITVAQLNALTTLGGADLSGLNLVGLASRPSSRGGNFTGSNLAGATLSASFFEGTPWLDGVNLSGTNLQNINLTRAVIFSADLSNTGVTATQIAQSALSRQSHWWLDEETQTWQNQTYYGFGNLNLMGTGITKEALRAAMESVPVYHHNGQPAEVSDLTFKGILFD